MEPAGRLQALRLLLINPNWSLVVSTQQHIWQKNFLSLKDKFLLQSWEPWLLVLLPRSSTQSACFYPFVIWMHYSLPTGAHRGHFLPKALQIRGGDSGLRGVDHAHSNRLQYQFPYLASKIVLVVRKR